MDIKCKRRGTVICEGEMLSDTLKGRVWRCKREVKKKCRGDPQQGRDARFIKSLLRKGAGNKTSQLRTLQAVGTV